MIRSFRNLSALKFDLIHEFEKHLPAAPFKYEWSLIQGEESATYQPVTSLEQWIPIAFAALHGVLAIVISLEIAGVIDWVK